MIAPTSNNPNGNESAEGNVDATAVQSPSLLRTWGKALIVDLRAVVVPFVVARIIVFLGYVVATAISTRWFANSPEALGEGLLAWDGGYYRDIAGIGYERLPNEALRFFPLFPAAGRLGAVGFGGNYALAVVLVANAAALVLAVLVRRFVRELNLDNDGTAADRAVWAVMLFPASFVLVWAYAEALFLVLAVGGMLAVRRQRWLIAAVLVGLAALCRPLGVLLALPVAIEAVRHWRNADELVTVRLASVAAVAAPAVGCLTFVVWVERAWGVWFLPFTIQSPLRGATVDPVTRLAKGVGDVVGPERFGDGLHIWFAFAFIALCVVTWRRLPPSLAAFGTAVLLVSLAAENLNSLERYALNGFPLVLGVAVIANTQRRERLALAVSGCGLLALTSLAWLNLYVP